MSVKIRKKGGVLGVGLEPTFLAEPDPKSGASANFATRALFVSSYLQQIQQKRLAIVQGFVQVCLYEKH